MTTLRYHIEFSDDPGGFQASDLAEHAAVTAERRAAYEAVRAARPLTS